MSITLRISKTLKGEITIAPLQGALKANTKVVVSKEQFGSSTIQLALKKGHISIEKIGDEDLYYLQSTLIKITNLSDKDLILEGYLNSIPSKHSIYVNKRILDNVNVQNAVENKTIKVSQIYDTETIETDVKKADKKIKKTIKVSQIYDTEITETNVKKADKKIKKTKKVFPKDKSDDLILDENSPEFKELFPENKEKEDIKIVAWDGANQKPLNKRQSEKKTFDNLNSDPLNAVVVKENGESLDSLVKNAGKKKDKKIKIIGREQKSNKNDPDSDLDAFIENGLPEISFVDHEQAKEKIKKSKHEKIRNLKIG